MPGRDDRHATDARGRAEAAFRKATTKLIEGPAPKPVVPGAREAITLRVDQDGRPAAGVIPRMLMRDAWLFTCAVLSLLVWAGLRLTQLLFGSRYGSAVSAGLVVGRIAVDRGW